ncbi:integrator complex subunit 10-like [Gigaspora margarita]|uniref:Integrator complex subunit 10 n=1 Tax=Gigaspora margarita TaxID=4874 RepID=A0A8H3XBJ1_GIGMA|nr:integrator complex subunit 10-like [Gigaspora margarita]
MSSDSISTAETSTVRDLTYYVNIISRYLSPSSGTTIPSEGSELSSDERLQYAIKYYHEAHELFPSSYEIKLLGHKIAIKEGNMTQAQIQFDELRMLHPDHEPLKEYLVEITYSVRHRTMDDNFTFFLRLPARTQKEVIINSAVWHENTNNLLDACELYALLLKAYPDTVTYYGAHAAQLALKCETQHKPLSESNKYRKLFVEDILEPILRQNIVIHEESLPSEIKVFNPQKDTSFPISTSTSPQPNYPTNFNVTHDQLKTWLERAQGFYIANKEWRKVFEVSFTVMASCGILKFESGPKTKLVVIFDDPKQLPSKVFEILNKESLTTFNNSLTYLGTGTPHPFALSIGIACFVHCCHEFYQFVAGLKSTPPEGNQRTCLTPIYIPGLSKTLEKSLIQNLSDNQRSSKKRKLSFLLAEESDDGDGNEMVNEDSTNNSVKNIMNVKNLLIEEPNPQKSDSTVTGREQLDTNLQNLIKEWEEFYNVSDIYIEEVRSYRERAMNCWKLCASLVERTDGETQVLEKELERLIKEWNLPFDVSNAILLTRGDIALSHGKVIEAREFYYEICSRSSGAWNKHRKEEKYRKSLLYPSSQSTHDDELDPTSTDESSIKEQIPLLLLFRVCYSISILHLAIDLWCQAPVELYMILVTIPFTPITQEHFEKDDWLVDRKMKEVALCDIECKRESFKWIETTQEDLMVRSIKELMRCFEIELNAGIKCYPLDQTLGNIIVLSQHGWPYWRDRMFRPIVLPLIKKWGGLIYPDLLRFVNNTDILRELLALYREYPNLNFAFCPISTDDQPASTIISIQALESCINRPSCNETLVAFYRERLAKNLDTRHFKL